MSLPPSPAAAAPLPGLADARHARRHAFGRPTSAANLNRKRSSAALLDGSDLTSSTSRRNGRRRLAVPSRAGTDSMSTVFAACSARADSQSTTSDDMQSAQAFQSFSMATRSTSTSRSLRRPSALHRATSARDMAHDPSASSTDIDTQDAIPADGGAPDASPRFRPIVPTSRRSSPALSPIASTPSASASPPPTTPPTPPPHPAAAPNLGPYRRREGTVSLPTMCSAPRQPPPPPPPPPPAPALPFQIGELWEGRIQILGELGSGTFGDVVRAYDHGRRGAVAIKIAKDGEQHTQMACLERNILEHIRSLDPQGRHAIVAFHEAFVFRGRVCLSFEPLAHNLLQLLSASGFQGVSLRLVRHVGAQLLDALAFLRRPEVGIIHCDIKPENILLVNPRRAAVKLIDFGGACVASRLDDLVPSRPGSHGIYIQSRYYRAPEVLLGQPFGHPIDMWSLGCLLAELANGTPLMPGSSAAEQLSLVRHLCAADVGSPDADWASAAELAPRLAQAVFRRSRLAGQPLGDAARDFAVSLSGLLQGDPQQRLTPTQALASPFWAAPGPHPGARQM